MGTAEHERRPYGTFRLLLHPKPTVKTVGFCAYGADCRSDVVCVLR